jgi:Rrf2 family transcriptional regulator, iron-sulfur cluster assembly transcription factor
MRLTNKGEYGVRAVVYLAAVDHARPVPVSKIAEAEGVSPEFLEQIFFRLKKTGMIRSVRGPHGGFVLDGDPQKITIKSILDAVGEPLYPVPCTDHDRGGCARRPVCSMTGVWHGFYEMMRSHLAGISVADVVARGASHSP